MGHLGSFSAAVREIDPRSEQDTFSLHGELFTVVDTIPPMLMLQLGASATGKIDDQEGLGAIWEAMRCSLTTPRHETVAADGSTTVVEADESQFSRFYKLAVAQKTDLEDLIKLAMALFEAQSARPTRGRPVSAHGPSTTSPSSSPSVSRTGLEHLTPVRDLVNGSGA